MIFRRNVILKCLKISVEITLEHFHLHVDVLTVGKFSTFSSFPSATVDVIMRAVCLSVCLSVLFAL